MDLKPTNLSDTVIDHFTLEMNGNNLINEEMRAKEFASRILGMGYSRGGCSDQKGLLSRALQKTNPTNVLIVRAKSVTHYALGVTSEEVVKELGVKFKGKFKFGLPEYAGVDLSVGAEFQNKNEQSQEKIVMAACHIDYRKCTYETIPPFETNVSLAHHKIIGDSFVRAGWIYTGYKIFFHISTESLERSKQIEVQGDPNITVHNWGIGVTLDFLNKKLANRNITNIEMEGEAFGNYVIPVIEMPKDSQGIQAVFQKIYGDYTSKKSSLTTHIFSMNEKCLGDYRLISQNNHPQALQPRIVESQQVSQSRIADHCEIIDMSSDHNIGLFQLVGKMKKQGFYDASTFGEKFHLGKLLEAINTIFSNNFLDQMNSPGDLTRYGLVVGPTGSGKSTWVGYQNGAKMKHTQIKNPYTSKMRQVVDYEDDHGMYPKIGHGGGSQTRGLEIWNNYIDTGGWYDSKGTAYNLCNMLTVKLATKYCLINRLILILEPDHFTKDRCSGLIKIIQKLGEVIHDPSREVILPSIAFIVTDKQNQGIDHLKTKIVGSIESAIEMLKSFKEELLSNASQNKKWQGISGYISSLLSQIVLQEDEVAVLNTFIKDRPDQVAKLDEYENQIKLLEQLLKLDNIFIANVFTDDTRNKIEEWENRLNTQPLPFIHKEVVGESELQFKTSLSIATHYFNHHYKEMENLNEQIKELQISIHQNAMSPSPLIQKSLETEVNELTATLKKHELNLELTCDEISERTNEMKVIQENKTPSFFKELIPNPPLRVRRIWEILGTIHVFETSPEKHPIPIHNVEITDSKVGRFFDKIEDLNQGKYRISFKANMASLGHPLGYQEVLETSVKLYVKTKDLPSSKSQIKGIKRKLKTLMTNKEELEVKIKGVAARISNIHAEVEQQNHTLLQQLEQERKSHLQILEHDLHIAIKKAKVIESELETCRKFYQLIRKIILKFEYHKDSTEGDAFIKFCASPFHFTLEKIEEN